MIKKLNYGKDVTCFFINKDLLKECLVWPQPK